MFPRMRRTWYVIAWKTSLPPFDGLLEVGAVVHMYVPVLCTNAYLAPPPPILMMSGTSTPLCTHHYPLVSATNLMRLLMS